MKDHCYTVKFKERQSPELVWADSTRQAAIIAKERTGATVSSVQPNYEAQNMPEKPQTWREYVLVLAR